MKNSFTFVDLFAGIGGFHEAAKHLGGHCVFASEIDKHAAKTYEANHGIKPHGDITKIEAQDIPDHDILFAGFPCQAFSVAGKRLGFEDTRGTLFFEVARIMKEKQPPIVVLENVKGLKSHDKGNTLAIILDTIKSLGYTVYHQVLNAKDFGIPQNRERIFIVCFKDNRLFTFPIPPKTPTRLGDILLDDVDERYFLSKKAIASAERHKKRHEAKGNGFGYKIVDGTISHSMAITSHYAKGGSEIMIFSDVRNGSHTIHSWDLIETTEREKYICQTILKNRRKKHITGKDGGAIPFEYLKNLVFELDESELEALIHKNILIKNNDGYEFVNSKQLAGINNIYRLHNENSSSYTTITAMQSYDAVAHKGIRRLTPRECARLQGFPDSFIFPVSDTQAYKQIGNAVCVPVVEAVLRNIFPVKVF